jgi:hypothetical protein
MVKATVQNVQRALNHRNEWMSGSCDSTSCATPKMMINSCSVTLDGSEVLYVTKIAYIMCTQQIRSLYK